MKKCCYLEQKQWVKLRRTCPRADWSGLSLLHYIMAVARAILQPCLENYGKDVWATPGGPGSSSDFSGSVSRGRVSDPGPPPWSLSPPCPPWRVLAGWLGLTHCWEVFLLQATPTSHTLSETVVGVCVCVCVCGCPRATWERVERAICSIVGSYFLVAKSCLTFLRPQAPLSMEFPSQEHWSGLPFPFPGDLPNPGIEPTSPAMADRFFTTEPPGTKCPLSQVQTDSKMQVLLCPQDLQLE